MRLLNLNQQPIELCKVLKLEGWVSSGGEAKSAIAAGLVRVNGEVEARKRKKIVSGDIVEYENQAVKIHMKTQMGLPHDQ